MTDPRYLPKDLHGKLAKLSEECAEVIKQVCKIQRFGVHAVDVNTDPPTLYDNKAMLRAEMYDLQLAMATVNDALELIPD